MGLREEAKAAPESNDESQHLSGDEALTKVRTDVHLVSEETVREDAARGIVVAQASRRAGERAMREPDFRRKGLLVSLVFIAMMVAGLLLLIRSWGDLAEV